MASERNSRSKKTSQATHYSSNASLQGVIRASKTAGKFQNFTPQSRLKSSVDQHDRGASGDTHITKMKRKSRISKSSIKAIPKSSIKVVAHQPDKHHDKRHEIHRLIYHPRIKQQEDHESITVNIIDYILIMAHFLTSIIAAYISLVGLTVISFMSSMQSIVGSENNTNINTVLRLSKSGSGTVIAIFLICVGISHILTLLTGVLGCVQGYRNALCLVIVMDIILVLSDVICAAVIINDGHCDKNELSQVQDNMLDYLRLYGTSYEPSSGEDVDSTKEEAIRSANFQMDHIQTGFTCCGKEQHTQRKQYSNAFICLKGVQGWSDYMDPDILLDDKGNAVVKKELDGTNMVLPASCCRAWWVRNVHCARGVHLWAHPKVDSDTALKFRQRIQQVGCIWKIKVACNYILHLAALGLLQYSMANAFLMLIKLIVTFRIIQRMLKIIRKKKEIIAKDTSVFDEDGDDEGWSGGRVILPTEDEIEMIKSRTDFNKFEARVKQTKIETWLNQARKSVSEETQEEEHLNSTLKKDSSKAGHGNQGHGDSFSSEERQFKLKMEREQHEREIKNRLKAMKKDSRRSRLN